ncbi:hypothetical protein SALBM311S_05897 [Streptomyces alboniger]
MCAPPRRPRRTWTGLLSAGASVNIYMFHGGTNFGFTNGANHHHTYAPTVTSNHDDALLTESGDPGPKYHAFREVIARHAPVPDGCRLQPRESARHRRPCTTGRRCCRTPGRWRVVRAQDPVDGNQPGVHGGQVTATFSPAAGDGLLHFEGGGDRVQVSRHGAAVGVLERERRDETLPVRVPHAGAGLEVLVENKGGVNYGPCIGAPEGAARARCPSRCRAARLGVPRAAAGRPGRGAVRPGRTRTAVMRAPPCTAARSRWTRPADTFLALPGWTKGQAWVNGFHLGRYWNRGPQQHAVRPRARCCGPGGQRARPAGGLARHHRHQRPAHRHRRISDRRASGDPPAPAARPALVGPADRSSALRGRSGRARSDRGHRPVGSPGAGAPGSRSRASSTTPATRPRSGRRSC